MKLGAIVICRYNSSRLPGKILKEINGKPILSYIIERLKCVKGLDEIVIATSDQESDQPIIDYCLKEGMKYYRGSLLNVAERFLNCSMAFGFDYSIRINGDNMFLDHRIISEMIEINNKNKYDMVSNVKGRTFPKGVSVEILNVKFYQKLFSKFKNKYFQEHVTIYFYENSGCGNFFHFKNDRYLDAAGAQLAIDTEEDLINAKKVVASFETYHTNYGFEEVFKRLSRIQTLQ